MRMIAVRHGETHWNKEGRQQGHLDSPLTALGVAQAQALARGLTRYSIDRIFSSDLGRARQTADLIAKEGGRSYEIEPRLRERHLGCFQGFTMEEARERFPEEYTQFKKMNPDWILPQGESIRQRYERTVEWAQSQAILTPDATVLAVCHGGVLMSFLHRALEIPLEKSRRYSLFNGAINIFQLDKDHRWTLEVWGEVAHMIDAGLTTLDDS